MGKSKKAAKSKAKPRRKPRPKAPAQEPEWGEPILVGNVGKLDVVIRPPLNEAAARTLTQEQMIMLVLEFRITKLERAVKKMEGEIDIHGRLGRLEGVVFTED